MTPLNALLLANLALYFAVDVLPALRRRLLGGAASSSLAAPLRALRHLARIAWIACLTGSALWSGAQLWLRLLRHLHVQLAF